MRFGFKGWLVGVGLGCIIAGMLKQPAPILEDFALELEESDTGWVKKPLSDALLAEHGVPVDGNLMNSIESYERGRSFLIIHDFKSARFEGLLNGMLKAELSGLQRRPQMRILSDEHVEKDGVKGFKIRAVGPGDDGTEMLATFYFFTTDNRGIFLRFSTPYNQAANVEIEAVLGQLEGRAESGKELHRWDDTWLTNRPAGFGIPHLSLLFGLLGIMLLGSGVLSAIFGRSPG